MSLLPRLLFPLACCCGITSLISDLTSDLAFAADKTVTKKVASGKSGNSTARSPKPYTGSSAPFEKSSPVAKTTVAQSTVAQPTGASKSTPLTEVELGWKSIAEWKTDEALHHFKSASQQSGGKPNYQVAWGFAAAYGQLSNFSESIRWFEKASEQYSKNSRMISDFGFTYMSWGVYQARTAKTKNDLADARRYWDESERKFLAAVELSPRESLSYSRLSMLSYYRGDLAQAWKYAKLSRKLGGEELDPRFLKDLSKHMPEPQ